MYNNKLGDYMSEIEGIKVTMNKMNDFRRERTIKFLEILKLNFDDTKIYFDEEKMK